MATESHQVLSNRKVVVLQQYATLAVMVEKAHSKGRLTDKQREKYQYWIDQIAEMLAYGHIGLAQTIMCQIEDELLPKIA